MASLSTALDARRVGSWLGAVDLAFLLLMSGTVTTVMCGGWAPFGEGVLAALAGVFAFVLKGWTLLLLVVYVADARRRERAPNPWKWAVPTSLLAGVSALGWLVSDLSTEVVAMIGGSLFAFSLMIAAYVAFRVWRGPKVAGDLHVYPFL